MTVHTIGTQTNHSFYTSFDNILYQMRAKRESETDRERKKGKYLIDKVVLYSILLRYVRLNECDASFTYRSRPCSPAPLFEVEIFHRAPINRWSLTSRVCWQSHSSRNSLSWQISA